MIKVVVLLRRPARFTREQFHRWWLDEHVPLVTILPGLRKYRVSLVTGSTSHPGQEPWDGIAELYFDDRAASMPRGRRRSGEQRWPIRGRATATGWCSSPKSMRSSPRR